MTRWPGRSEAFFPDVHTGILPLSPPEVSHVLSGRRPSVPSKIPRSWRGMLLPGSRALCGAAGRSSRRRSRVLGGGCHYRDPTVLVGDVLCGRRSHVLCGKRRDRQGLKPTWRKAYRQKGLYCPHHPDLDGFPTGNKRGSALMGVSMPRHCSAPARIRERRANRMSRPCHRAPRATV